MAFALTVAAVTKAHIAGSIRLRESVNARGSLDVAIESLDGTYRPDMDDAVVLSVDGTPIFGGEISTPQESGAASGAALVATRQALNVPDYNSLADRRYVSWAPADGQTVKALVTALIASHLVEFGVTLDPAQEVGATLSGLNWDYVKVAQVLSDLGALAPGWIWRINPSKVLRLFAPGTLAAPFSITDATPHCEGDVTVAPSRDDYANRVIYRWGSGDTPQTTVVEDAGEIAAHGRWEVVLANPDVHDGTTATALATAELQKRVNTPKIVTFQTRESGLHAGQTIPITLTARNVDNTFLITDLDVSDRFGELVYRATALEGTAYGGSWRDGMRAWGGSASSTGFTTPAAAPTPLVIDLGGSLRYDVQGAGANDAIESPPLYVTAEIAAKSCTVRCQVKTLNAGTSVQPRIWNVTDAVEAAAGSVTTNTAWEDQTFGVTLAAGKTYQLQLVAGNGSYGVMGHGKIYAL